MKQKTLHIVLLTAFLRAGDTFGGEKNFFYSKNMLLIAAIRLYFYKKTSTSL